MDRGVRRDTSVVPRERVANKISRQVQSAGAAEQVVLSRRGSQSHNTRCCPSPRVMMQGREVQRLRRLSTMQGDSTLGNDCDVWRQMLPSLPGDFVKGKKIKIKETDPSWGVVFPVSGFSTAISGGRQVGRYTGPLLGGSGKLGRSGGELRGSLRAIDSACAAHPRVAAKWTPHSVCQHLGRRCHGERGGLGEMQAWGGKRRLIRRGPRLRAPRRPPTSQERAYRGESGWEWATVRAVSR